MNVLREQLRPPETQTARPCSSFTQRPEVNVLPFSRFLKDAAAH